MEACTLCREKYPGDGDRCEENRKPVPDEPGEAAKVTAQAAEKPLSSASLTAVLLNAGAPSGGVLSGSGLQPCRGDGRSACRALACARVREHPAAVDRHATAICLGDFVKSGFGGVKFHEIS